MLYIRSGRQIRRDGLFYALIYVLLEKVKSPFLFRIYQKRNLINVHRHYDFYPSIALDAYSTENEVISFINSMKDEEAAILMLHSVLEKTDAGYGKDKYFNDIQMFESICKFCAENEQVKVVTNRRLFEIQKEFFVRGEKS